MNDTSENPLFGSFKPTAIDVPVKENPYTGETSSKKPRKKREPKVAKPAKEPKPPKQKRVYKPRAAAAAIESVQPPVSNLQTLFAAMKGLESQDHDLFEFLLAASPASRKRVFVAIAKIFP